MPGLIKPLLGRGGGDEILLDQAWPDQTLHNPASSAHCQPGAVGIRPFTTWPGQISPLPARGDGDEILHAKAWLVQTTADQERWGSDPARQGLA